MPNRPVHDIARLVTGVAEGMRMSNAATSSHPSLEIVAAALGGVVGSRCPDWLEPATAGPRHRAHAHDVVFGVAVAKLPVDEWQAACRRAAAAHESRATLLPEGSLERLIQQLLVYFWHALAGVLCGLRAGYLSHLSLDFTTPSSLPLVGY